MEAHPANYSGCKVRKEILQRRQTTVADKSSNHKRPAHTYTMRNEDFPSLPVVTNCKTTVVAADDTGTWKNRLQNITTSTYREPTSQINLETKLNMLLEKMSSMMDLLTLVVTKLCK